MKACILGFMLLGCLAFSVHAESEWCREQRSTCVDKCQPDDIYFDCYDHDGGTNRVGAAQCSSVPGRRH